MLYAMTIGGTLRNKNCRQHVLQNHLWHSNQGVLLLAQIKHLNPTLYYNNIIIHNTNRTSTSPDKYYEIKKGWITKCLDTKSDAVGVNNNPTMHCFTGISKNTQSKSYMLSLTECVWDFQIMHCGILINMPYSLFSAPGIGHTCIYWYCHHGTECVDNESLNLAIEIKNCTVVFLLVQLPRPTATSCHKEADPISHNPSAWHVTLWLMFGCRGGSDHVAVGVFE